MNVHEPSFTIGIEEEYFLVDRETRDLAVDPPQAMMDEYETRLHGQVQPEFLRAQIEVATKVCTNITEARENLAHLRQSISEVAGRYGLAPIAAATHPFAAWEEQEHTDRARYNMLAKDLQAVARRLLICGLHVHVGIEDDDLRLDLMNQVTYFLPHLLALSTSSPFWRGENTGLMSYRLSVFDGLPRTGLPDFVASYPEYQRLIAAMVSAGLVDDATKIWWDVRLSDRFPTLELRMTDVCTRLEDTLAVAALYLCVLGMLMRLRRNNQRWRVYPRTLVNENRWLAQRHGTAGELVDFGRGERVPYSVLLDELLDYVREDAERFDCVAEVEHAREIARRGTSASRQLDRYNKAVADGADHDEALRHVVDLLIEETVIGVEADQVPAAGAR